MNQEEKDNLFKTIANDIAKTLSDKNSDYGDSFHSAYEKFGDISTLIRLYDKIGRIESLIKNKENMKIKDEPLEDALLDIAGYCILTLASRHRIQEGKSSEEGGINNE